MAGGYNNQFSQYQALPTNLQNYTGGTGSPALMNQGQQSNQMQSANMYRPMMPRMPFMGMGGMPFMGMNPFAFTSPYAFMGGMGRNWGVPGGYNAAAQVLSGVPVGGHMPSRQHTPLGQPTRESKNPALTAAAHLPKHVWDVIRQSNPRESDR